MSTKGNKIRTLKGEPRDFSQLAGIGPLETMGWAKIPTYYYDYQRIRLPLIDSEVDRFFGSNISVFDETQDNPDQVTNAATGKGVNEAFVALGAGIIAIGEGEAFAINGALVDVSAEGNTPPLQVSSAGLSSCYCGAVDLTGQAETTRLATFWWGAPTWRFIEKFFQAYRLQVIVQARFLIVDEALDEVGMVPQPAEFVGASDSNIPTMPFIRGTNDVMVRKQLGSQFFPANYFVQCGACGEDDDTPRDICLPPPLAPVTYGHPRIIGLANRIYCFNQPILFIPGMRFEVEFFNQSDINQFIALKDSIRLNCTTASQFAGADANGFVNCGVNCTVPGGMVNLGVVFKGFALWPQACLEYLARYICPGTAYSDLYSQTAASYLGGLMSNPDIDKALLGKVAGTLGLPKQLLSE